MIHNEKSAFSLLKSIFRCIVPGFIRMELLRIKNYEKYQNIKKEIKKYKRLKTEIINYLLNKPNEPSRKENKQIIKYLRNQNDMNIAFPYNFVKKYDSRDIDVYGDELDGMKYVLYENKKLYFPEDWTVNHIRDHYNGLRVEQDKESPHRYEDGQFRVKNGDVILDVGAAEGIWALSNINEAKRVYLFECEEKWIKALTKTFDPWKEKVVIINKYVSNNNEGGNITLDSLFYNDEINFIKADIEGDEVKMLEGASMILSNQKKLRLLVCTYHRKDDAVNIKNILEKNNYSIEYSHGYMLFIYDKNISPPYLRKGLIRAYQ
jgi:hypothetical protein